MNNSPPPQAAAAADRISVAMESALNSLRPSELEIIHFPDPRLRTPARAVSDFGPALASLVARMFECMRAARGVGRAAPQLGVGLRVFVINVTGDPANDLVFVNPQLHDLSGTLAASEGCLSIPEVHVEVRRAARCRAAAHDLGGRAFEIEGEGLLARAMQHELDHLNGVLIVDRMGPSDRIATRRTLRELEDAFARLRPAARSR